MFFVKHSGQYILWILFMDKVWYGFGILYIVRIPYL
jgi:hypothetical protein